jgi:putative transposase
VYDTLMQCSAATLSEFAANERWLGGIAAFTLVLHTWTQDLRRHLHVHALMACGALKEDDGGGAHWVAPRRAAGFLFPVQALSRVFRGKFLAALQHATQTQAMPRDPAQGAQAVHERQRALRAHDWVVYAKTPLAGPAAVLDYLSRYTHRTAIGNERLIAIEAQQVYLRVRQRNESGKRSIAIDGAEFVARLMQHVLPPGFKRIRHYGLLAPAGKTGRLTQARAVLHMPLPNPQAAEDARAFMRRVATIDIERCPHCSSGRWQVICERSADRIALASVPTAACRGPP